jgi:hypothetical protein
MTFSETSNHDRTPFLFIVIVFVVSRLVLEGVGVLAVDHVRPALNFQHVWNYSDSKWLNIWGVWDTGWYLSIADGGYDLSRHGPGPTANQANWAFFPAYPLVARWLSYLLGLPTFATMVALSNACFVVALHLAWKFCASEFGARAAHFLVLILCFMPGSYVFSSAYPESMFLMFVAATLVLVHDERWLAAGVAAAFATLTRNLGIGLVLYIALAALSRSLARPVTVSMLWSATLAIARQPGVIIAMALPVVALAGHCAYLWMHVGDPLAFMTVQDGWLRHLRSPLETLLAAGSDIGFQRNPLNLVEALVLVALLVHLAFLRHWPLFALGAFVLMVPLAAGVESIVRYALCMLPLTISAAVLCKANPASFPLVLATLATLNGFMMVGWALGFLFVI